MYNNIRLALWVIIFVIVALIILKSKILRKKLMLFITGILCLLACTLTTLMPVENLFIDFDTPEAVFNYTTKGYIVDTLERNDSCLIYYREKNGIYSHCFVKKAEEKYGILPQTASKMVNHIFNTIGTFDVYHIVNTNDFYVIGVLPTHPETVNLLLHNTSTPIEVKYIPNTYFSTFISAT